jgi:hypothetical protein
MTRSVFFCFGATVGSLTGRTSCGFWWDDPDQFGWNPASLVPVDLGKNPEAVRKGLITLDQLQVDDYSGYAFGGLTQIGPMWPGGRMNGQVWLEENYWKSLAIQQRQPPRNLPGMQGFPQEMTSVLYWDGVYAGRRFNGIYGRILQKQMNRGLVALFERGSSQFPGKQPYGTFWLDFSKDVLPIEPGFTEVGLGSTDPQSGILFVDATVLAVTQPPMTKTPKYLGGVATPRKRCA